MRRSSLPITEQVLKDRLPPPEQRTAVRETGSRAVSLRRGGELDRKENALQNTEVTANSQNG